MNVIAGYPACGVRPPLGGLRHACSKSLYLVNNRAKDIPAGQGPAVPSDRSPSRRQRARLSVVYWSPGPSRALTPRPAAAPYRIPRAGLRSNLPPIAVMSTMRGQRRPALPVRRFPAPAGSRADPGPRCLRAVRLQSPSACEGGHDTPGVTQRSRGCAGSARIAVTMVVAGSAVPWWENSLAARMTWPHHLASPFPSALQHDRLPGPCELSAPGSIHCHESSSSRRSSK